MIDKGNCQFCGANTTRGIHECVEIFSLGFQEIDYSKPENHGYRFLSVDAHALQHPEIHGRWSNHFHLTRLHLIFAYKIEWNYSLSPKLSDYLNVYKENRKEEFLTSPEILKRGNITTTDILQNAENEAECQEIIRKWALEVYDSWSEHHARINDIAIVFNRIY